MDRGVIGWGRAGERVLEGIVCWYERVFAGVSGGAGVPDSSGREYGGVTVDSCVYGFRGVWLGALGAYPGVCTRGIVDPCYS